MVLRCWQTAHIDEAAAWRTGRRQRTQRQHARQALRRQVHHQPGASPTASAHEVGSIEVGKWADLVFWKPKFFGVKPSLVLKGGFIAVAAMGDPNASIPTPQPVHYRPMFGSFGGAVARGSLTFMSQAAVAADLGDRLGLRKHGGRRQTAAAASRKARHGAQRLHTGDADRRADLRGARRRRAAHLRAGRRCCRWPSGTSCSEATGTASPAAAGSAALARVLGLVAGAARCAGAARACWRRALAAPAGRSRRKPRQRRRRQSQRAGRSRRPTSRRAPTPTRSSSRRCSGARRWSTRCGASSRRCRARPRHWTGWPS